MAVLAARGLTKDYREGRGLAPVLRGVDLDLEQGEVVVLEGPSGSGKTTLLYTLGCLLTPTSGRLTIEGVEVDPRRPARLAEVRRRSIGFAFQDDHLFPGLSAIENVEYGLNLRGIGGPVARREASRMIEAVGLDERRDARPRDLSGGQRQRVAIARALAGPAPILLADEPTAHLDSEAGAQVLGLFRGLALRERRALLVVTHDPSARAIADRVFRIKDGRLGEVER